MKFTQTHEVYKDTLTGVCYSKGYAFKPIAVIDGPGKSSIFGVLLEPYGDHPSADWNGIEEWEDWEARVAKFGFQPNAWGQDVLVTEEQLASRFEYLGELSKEIDMDAAVQQYEQECCDFSKREKVAQSAIQQLQKMVPALWACELYTLIKDYMANTPK